MKAIDFNDYAIKLSNGKHPSPQEGMCIMECVAYIEGEQHTDHPKCACPVVTVFAIRTNDWMRDEERNVLLPYVLRIAGSKSTREIEKQRAYMAADYAVRVFAPITLRLRGYENQAKHLQACAKIIDKETALAGRDVARFYADADADADAAAYASYAATYAAADADAHAATYAAADAADYASYAAADAYWETRAELVQARLQLLDDMLQLTEPKQTPHTTQKLRELAEIAAV